LLLAFFSYLGALWILSQFLVEVDETKVKPNAS